MLVAGNSEVECEIARFLNSSSSSLQLIAAGLKISYSGKIRGPVGLIGECILTVPWQLMFCI